MKFSWPRSHYVTQAGFEPKVILLPQLPIMPRDKLFDEQPLARCEPEVMSAAIYSCGKRTGV